MSSWVRSRFWVRTADLPIGFSSELARDAPVYWLIFGHAAIVLTLAALLNGNAWAIFSYMPGWLAGLRLVAPIWLCWVVGRALLSALKENPERPLNTFLAGVRRRFTARLAAGVLLYLTFGLFYGAFTLMKTMLPSLASFSWDVALAQADGALHFGADPWTLLHPFLGSPVITRSIEVVYGPVWGLLLVIVPLLVCTSALKDEVRTRFLVSFVACWILLGNLVAGLFLSGGPIFYAQITGDAERFAALNGYLAFSEGLPFSSSGYRDYLWSWYQSGEAGIGSGISAFPSMHVATATLCALLLRRACPRLQWLGFAWVAVILLGSVHLAWHYAIDGYASILVVLLAWRFTPAVLRRLGWSASASVHSDAKPR